MTLVVITDKNMRIRTSARDNPIINIRIFINLFENKNLMKTSTWKKENIIKEAQIIRVCLQNLNPNNKKAKRAGVCNSTTYSLKKGILKYGKRGR